MLLMLILGPLAAAIIQMAISRSREFQADASGAPLTDDPLALASALGRSTRVPRRCRCRPTASSPAPRHLMIDNPFRGGGIAKLFSTHPPMEERSPGWSRWPATGPVQTRLAARAPHRAPTSACARDDLGGLHGRCGRRASAHRAIGEPICPARTTDVTRRSAVVGELQGDAEVLLLEQAITACRSSFFLPVTRSWSPWICACTPFGPSSRIFLLIALAFSARCPG